MTDLKALTHELLSEAQQSLRADGRLNPTAIVITPSQNLIFDVEYQNEEERDDIYSEIVEAALAKNASAILTVDDVHLDGPGSPVRLQGTGWGALADSATEAIMITVSGSGFATWSMVCPYVRNDDQIVFQPPQEKPDPGGEVELLGDWTGTAGTA
ncbi:MAG TPA: hypothetical protein VN176_10330 [Verrucomicrobiae bacterium]|jgi:hypothetical protein|nr:hypothetical protein [Verrucomicrobiae bacterium]